MQRPYLLLDAGGTLVWPNPEIVREAAACHGCRLDGEAIFRAYFQTIHQVDLALRDGPGAPTAAGFFASLFANAGAPGAAVSDVERICRRASPHPWKRTLWTYLLPWTSAVLGQLHAAGYRMSVISNSDGTVASSLADLGLACFFDEVLDSQLLGVEKPDPRIFRLALERLGLQPSDCVFVGDVFMVDVVGANAAGIAAVHLDPLELYAGWPGAHTRDLQTFADGLLSR